jgi:hypothetical protein
MLQVQAVHIDHMEVVSSNTFSLFMNGAKVFMPHVKPVQIVFIVETVNICLKQFQISRITISVLTDT